MIICGFPGIGKSTLAKSDLKYIDFESTNFDKSNPEWYLDYCECICDLSDQGYTVFCSSHSIVTKTLSRVRKIKIIYPALELYDAWYERVQQRYDNDPSEKNARALKFVKEYLDEGIVSVVENYSNNDNVELVPITDINYKLENIIGG